MVSLKSLKLSTSVLLQAAASSFKNCRIISMFVSDESVSKRYGSNKTSHANFDRYESIEARTVEFTPSRARDVSGATLNLHENNEVNCTEFQSTSLDDDHVNSYDAHGSISLNSVMQTNVPEPFTTEENGTPTHLNMPGGHTSQNQKYLSDNLQNTHYSRSSRNYVRTSQGMSNVWHAPFSLRIDQIFYVPCSYNLYKTLLTPGSNHPLLSSINIRHFFKKNKSETARPTRLSQRQKFKKAIKEYGVTILIFHIVISLISLGGFYLAISSGINLLKLLESLGLEIGMINRKFAAGASTFVIAYAIHKVFAPARIAITLAAAPFIVRYLRKMKILKPPKR